RWGDPRRDGPQRVWEEHPRAGSGGPPVLHGHPRRSPLRRARPDGHERRGAGARGRLPRIPVPGGDPRRGQRVLSEGRGQRDSRPPGPGRDGRDGVSGLPAPAAQVRRDGPELHEPRRQRGILRRREEAKRDPADGRARAAPGHSGRDGLWARHRRPEDRCWGCRTAAGSIARDDPRDPLSEAAELRDARLRARPDGRQNRALGRKRARPRARGQRLRLAQAGDCMTAPPVTRHPVSEKDQYLQAIATLAGQRDAAEPVWLARLRNVAADRFRRLRFPTIHDEEWKYTSVAPMLRGSFTSPPGGAPATVSNDDVGKTIVDTDGPRLVFVDGRYVAELSRPVTGSAEMVATLPHGVDADPDTIEAHLGRLATTADNIFSALNTALLSDCGVIVVPRGVVLDEPIQLVFVSALDHAAIAPRMLVVLGAASAATIVETYVSLGSPEAFTNAVAEIVVGEGATLSHFRVVDEAEGTVHIGRTEVRQGSDGAYESLTVFASAALGRHDLAVHLDGPGATCTL